MPPPAEHVLSLSAEVYGNTARASCLADWLETSALAGRRVTRDDLTDIIADNGWSTLTPRQISVDPADEMPEEWPDAAFGLLGERHELLGDHWPFQLTETRITPTVRPSTDGRRYLALLGMTIAHAWGIPGPHDPTILLEEVATRAYKRAGCRAFGTGTAAAGGGRGKATVVEAGRSVGLRPVPDPNPIRRSARDTGVDVLAVAVPTDHRPGQALLLVQVTCARSDSWQAKLSQPRSDLWARYLNDTGTRPLPVLVVPHHVEPPTLRYLTGADSGGLIVDRLRLVRMLTGESLTMQENDFVDFLDGLGVDDGRAAAIHVTRPRIPSARRRVPVAKQAPQSTDPA